MISLLNKIGQVSRKVPIQPSVWPHFDLIYVHSNGLLMTVNNADRVTIGENQAIFIYPGTVFSGTSLSGNVTTVSVHHFSMKKEEIAELPPALRSFFSSQQPFVKFTNTEMIKSDIQRLIKWDAAKDDTHAFMLNSLISLVMGNLIMNLEQIPLSPIAQTMCDIDKYIRKNIAQAVTSTALARQAGLSVNYFRILFTDFFGMTPGKHINMIRMQEAARLLSETILPIKAVARKVGIAQPSNFHRSFLRFHKTTPRKFRNKVYF